MSDIGLAKDHGGHLVNQTRFITFSQALRNNSWRSNKHNEKKTENESTQNIDGTENVQVKKAHAYVHRRVDQI